MAPRAPAPCLCLHRYNLGSSPRSRRGPIPLASTAIGRYIHKIPTDSGRGHAGQGLRTVSSGKSTAKQDLFLTVLNATSTKREARSYLSRFGLSTQPSPSPVETSWAPGVNLGSFYGSTTSAPLISARDPSEPLHLALIKLRDPASCDEDTLRGIGLTLSQLNLLGLCSVIVVDTASTDWPRVSTRNDFDRRRWIREQSDRVVSCIIQNHGPPAVRLEHVVAIDDENDGPALQGKNNAYMRFPDQLLRPLRRGIIPVIPAIAYTKHGQMAVPIDADEVVLALAMDLADKDASSGHQDAELLAREARTGLRRASLEKLIILDPLGGIPSARRPTGSHIFINMEQEYEKIKDELEIERFASLDPSESIDPITDSPRGRISSAALVHLGNLKLMRDVLSLLPPSSSALLATPNEVANSGRLPKQSASISRVSTRRRKNPLIHNLLTDKPSFSSSLPVGRISLPQAEGHPSKRLWPIVTPTTFVKRGMPLTILPDPGVAGWTSSRHDPAFSPQDPRIDLQRLVHLIEDSFGRRLDVAHYLSRLQGRLAGLIISGDYEGGALFTWESPAGSGPIDSDSRLVPYLDKFAVLKRSQGAGGVADILFTAMVRTCFPSGVCWRSRRDNPVNKWYFERASGAWKLPDSNWTMFWTTPAIEANVDRFRSYEAVCRTVEPSWADPGPVVD